MFGKKRRKMDELDNYITRRQQGEAGGEDPLVDHLFGLADAIQSGHTTHSMMREDRADQPYSQPTSHHQRNPVWGNQSAAGMNGRKHIDLPEERERQHRAGM